MAEKRDILWRFLGDAKSLNRATKSGEKGLGTMQGAMGGMSKAAGALGIAVGAGALVQGIGSAISKAEEMESQYAITESILDSTGNAAGITAEEIKEAAKQMALTTGIPKEVALEAQNVLLTFTNLKAGVGEANGAFERATTLTGDMATVFGGSAKDAAKQLGKALNDPIGGIGALSRVGVQFTADQKKMIKAMVEAGDVAGAQNIILAELETQVGGTAEASADSSEKMKRGWDEISEALGKELLPALDDLSVVVGELTPAISGLASAGGNMVQELFGWTSGVSQAADSTQTLSDRLSGANDAFNDWGRAVLTTNPLMWALIKLTDDATSSAGRLTGGADRLVETFQPLPALTADVADEIHRLGRDAAEAEAKIFSLDDMVNIFRGDLFDLAGAIERANVRKLWEGGGGSGQTEDTSPSPAPAPAPSGGNIPEGFQNSVGRAPMLPTQQTVVNIHIGVAGDPYQTAQVISDLLTQYEQSNGSRLSGVSL